jgi:hypothetical protein
LSVELCTSGKGFVLSQEPSISTRVKEQRFAAIAGVLETKGPHWRDDVRTRGLVQILQTEPESVRVKLAKTLSETKTKSAATALAQRAVFDLSLDVRDAAVKALKDRPCEDYRPVLLEALRYPWPPVADRAAEALVALGDRDTAMQLVDLLDKPDPRAPFLAKDSKWKVPELVRVNHLGNCLLCHAPADADKDQVLGLIPKRDMTLIESYCGGSGDFVRADVTYLRQDFSLLQPVPDPGKWPRLQRFDYLIRNRELSDDEVACLPDVPGPAGKPASYPQRDAVLWALRQLTGEDAGDNSEDWYYLLQLGCGVAPDL